MNMETLDSSSCDMNQPWIQQEEMMSHWPNPSSFLVKAQSLIGTLCYHHTQSAAGWPQDKIHPSFLDIPWNCSKVIRSVQLQAKR
jgi:hypothetical protein